MNKKQLRELIQDVLKSLEPNIPYSEAAVELLMMTAAHESNLGEFIKQVKGPALGIYQMEPATYNDIFDNYLIYKHWSPTRLGADVLRWSLWHSTTLARIHYYRVAEALPETIEGASEYAKKYYNTIAGKATATKYLEDYLRLVS
jgi:hypothetical protein